MSYKKKMAKKPASTEDRLPPHSPQAEQGILGCILTPGEEAAALAACEEAGLQWPWFYDLRHQVIWDAAYRMHKAGRKVDAITLYQELKDKQGYEQGEEVEEKPRETRIEQIGGLVYLGELQTSVASVAMLPEYLEIVREKWIMRSALTMCISGAEHVYQVPDSGTLISKLEHDILKLGESRTEPTERRIKDLVVKVIAELEEYHRGKPQIRGLTTGLEYVDKLLCGIGGANGNYFVISARPNVGKTAFALQIAEHAALDYVWWDPVLENGKPVMVPDADGQEKFKMQRKVGIPVGIFSLEMTAHSLASRMLFHRARGDMQRSRTGYASSADMEEVKRAAGVLAAPDNIFIDDDNARLTIGGIRAKARRWYRERGVRLFIIDYIQLVRVDGKRFRQDRVQELAEISSELVGLGKQLNVPILVLAQMNRDYEKEPNREPRLADLKDCGSIEQDADVVGFLHKPKLRDEAKNEFEDAMRKEFGGKDGQDWSSRMERINITFAKARNGPQGYCKLLFQKSCTHFMDWVVWLKDHGYAGAAAGEGARYKREAVSDLPSNEEMGLDK